jgi:hypothetical protein
MEKRPSSDEKEKDIWDQVDVRMQGIIGERIGDDLIGIVEEQETAFGQYMAIISAVERVVIGDEDDAEMEMRNFMQTSKSGETLPLEEYLAQKVAKMKQYESIRGEDMDEQKEIKYVLKGFSSKNFGSWPFELLLKMKKGTKLKMSDVLEEARGREDHRFKGEYEETVKRGETSNGNFRGLQGRINERETRNCFNCEKEGHLMADCPSEKRPRCFKCQMTGHRAKTGQTANLTRKQSQKRKESQKD